MTPRRWKRDVRAILTRVAREGVPAGTGGGREAAGTRAPTELQRNSIPELASVWSDAIALYGLSSPDEDLQRIERVTVADVNRVARKYLDLDHAVTGVMLPRGSGGPVAARGGFGGQESISLGEAQPTALPPWAQKALTRLERPSLDPAPRRQQACQWPHAHRAAGGCQRHGECLRAHPQSPGDARNPRASEGVAPLLDRLLTYGSERLDRVAFQQALDAIGAEEQAGTDFSLRCCSEYFDRAVELLADNQLHPALPDAALQVLRSQLSRRGRGAQRKPRLPHAALAAQGALPAERPGPAHGHTRERTRP